ncbi:MAG TPA: 30S ribosomal protein S4 [Candidatus Sulfobium mesophilum]|uniref:Small ribosomal subunit protein uS4 n=1 Tax=Candidatus Sulfobium mesophilum TaxID=2016548 RepID=A0A2U3QKX5_9BACT|nr:30S ribosomal subunit protein S4 [Candidatus Sulfobium mesophilum]HSB32304.1 30S ribosomal protein S4 [Candidatus Sulfobium mesophilum]
MARYTGPQCRLCRRETEKLFLKGDRCFTEKCAVERRQYPPGQHGQRRGKLSDYGVQLREKQKVRNTYGVLEKQFRKYFHKAERKKGVTGEVLLQFLETRMDNIVHRMGFAPNRNSARQLVRHGHFLINGRDVNVPSFNVHVGDIVEVRTSSRDLDTIKDSISRVEQRGIPSWVEMDFQNFKGKVLQIPSREDIQLTAQEQLIVELYSK